MTKAAMKGVEKDHAQYHGSRGDYVELDPASLARPLPQVRIDGPYGAPAEDVFDNEAAVLIGAGIGMSPFISSSPSPSSVPYQASLPSLPS